MIHRPLSSAFWIVPVLVAITSFLLTPGCFDEEMDSRGPSSITATPPTSAPLRPLPLRGKPRLAAAPSNAVFGMIYINSADNREYIFDGAEWVPHDSTVDDYYRNKAGQKLARLPVFPTGFPLPEPTGAHGLPSGVSGGPTKHGGYDCKTCHVVGGVFSFSPTGPAVAAGHPLPAFDNVAKTCANVACHGIYSGTFSYYFPGGDGEPELKTVNYAGNGGATPSWYATGLGCASCHGNPPSNGTWHSGYHGGQGPTGAYNQCQFCHPDATGSGGHGTAITNTAMHGNGTVEVQARFTSSCFGCH